MQTIAPGSVEAELRLNPITPSNTGRYDYAGPLSTSVRSTDKPLIYSLRIRLCPQFITRGPASCTSTALPSKWLRFVHPEGQLYFVLDNTFDFVVITEAYIDDIQTKARIFDCLKVVTNELHDHNIKVPSRCELFLELGQNSSCNYYFVDHVAKGLFWLQDMCSQMIGIPVAMSSSHLEQALERQYWLHIEYFPMHHTSHEQEFSQTVDDLYNIISHGQADRLTSRTSTFPYTADTCKQFLKLLSRKRGQRLDGYTLCYAARLAGSITNQRFLTFYGQQFAQLDRLQEMCPANTIEHRWLLAMANLLLWGIPQHYIGCLDDLYVNEQVYVDQWTHFMSLCLADWTNSLSWSLPVIIASILLANVHGGTVFMSMPSVLSCAVSIASACCLHLRHHPLAESTATDGARYLRFAKWNSVGFLPSSVAFSLPRAGCLWGVGLLTTQFIFVASHTVNKFVALVAASAIAALLTFLLSVINPEKASALSLCRSLVSLCIPRLYSSDAREGEYIV